ncbi:uncharacterized protein BYT42DRAFT_577376 [Radiomyces spectabilis]|uniref:uncharacterized protein n=1 Tax=Radiomyces spectabilis TaxID=64574 RepID=UPI002220038A|nr:uncharacterized protein BYT42DRAFT_577376 [Radiomyces spectabilis]KAI8374714.1 hypothetical protein BYT42DRAFT_577376 [Radiomyces spectabilis]
MEAKQSQRPASLKHILERSKLLTSQIEQSTLPSIERGLDQIDSQSQKLSSAPTDSSEDNVRAHYFLAKAGVNTSILVRELGTIHMGAPTEPRKPIQDTDLEGYLLRKQTQTIVDFVQAKKQEIYHDTDEAFDRDLYWRWQELKQKLDVGEADTAEFASWLRTKHFADAATMTLGHTRH